MKTNTAVKPAYDTVKPPYDTVGNIIAFESGELDAAGVVELFQHLLDTGLVWQLQGSYGRLARTLIAAGEIFPK